MSKQTNRIYDRDVSDANYAKFAQCEMLHDGIAVRFRYPSGVVYDVAVGDILSWFKHPHHYMCGAASLKDWPSERTYIRPPSMHVKMVRRVLHGHALRVYMNDDTAYDVAWDTVLMACESQYEWFGGLSKIVNSQE